MFDESLIVKKTHLNHHLLQWKFQNKNWNQEDKELIEIYKEDIKILF
jgi:hypothetical protein